jgi:uncharacterized protein (TIGR02466 family)
VNEAVRRAPSAALLYELAGLLLDRGDGARAAEACKRAYALDIDVSAVERLIQGGQARERAAMLVHNGFAATAAIAALVAAEAKRGNDDAVARLLDRERFLRTQRLAFATADNLAACADLLRQGRTFYAEPRERSIRHAWRYDSLREDQGPEILKAMMAALRRAVEDYACDLPGEAHPFIAARPRQFGLEAWGVISGAEGHHEPHIHRRAWASGVFYIAAPRAADDPAARTGWLRVGFPATSRHGEAWIKPEPGLLLLMPAYFHHETRPTGLDEDRICVAFDVVPTEVISG